MVDGPQAGASTTTGADGQFSFSGSFGFAAGSITFRATKVGYADLLQKVNVSLSKSGAACVQSSSFLS